MDGRRLFCPRGKSLGGSSSMNAMLYVRGRPLDYDQWEEQGADGWGWASLRPYFLKAENDERGASEHHAAGGPVNVGGAALAAPHERRLHPRGRGVRDPARRGLQQPGAGRRRDVPDVPEARPPLELRRRLPAAGDEARQPRGRDARAGPAPGAGRQARDRRRVPAPRPGARRPRHPRGDPRRGRLQLAAAPAAVGHRPGRAPRRGGRAGRARAARRRPEPPGPPLHHDDLGDVGPPFAVPGRRAAQPRGVGAPPLRPADVHRRRVVRLRPHPAGAAGGRHPVPRRRRLLREPRRRRSTTATAS